MKWLAFIAGTIVVLLCVLAFIFRTIDSNEDKAGKEFEKLAKFAKSHSSVREILQEAARSRYTFISVWPPPPKDLKVKDENQLPSREWTEWTTKNVTSDSLGNMAKVVEHLSQLKRGLIQLSDPKDNPLQYDRRLLQFKFDGDTASEVEIRSL